MVDPVRVEAGSTEEADLHALVAEHVAETGSPFGAHLLRHWADARELFWRLVPNNRPADARSQALVHVPLWTARSSRARLVAPQAQQQQVAPEVDAYHHHHSAPFPLFAAALEGRGSGSAAAAASATELRA